MDERQDTVTREQVQEWAKLAGLSWFTEGDLEGLADFAIFARAAFASAPAQPMYLSESDLERLQDPRISGKGCFISKEPRDGFVLIAPASSVASKEKQ